MDALDELELMEGDDLPPIAGPASSRGESSSDKRALVPADSWTPVKKAKKEEGQSDDDLGLVTVKFEECEDVDKGAQEKLPCTGCGRLYLISLAWFGSGLVEWATKKGTGNWCKDCLGCWRLMFSDMQTNLVSMGTWLRHPAHRLQWEQTLVAYLTLKREQEKRVNKVTVQMRLDSLKWASSLFGAPFGPLRVCMLRDLPPRTALESERLVNVELSSGSGHCIGYLLPEPSPKVIIDDSLRIAKRSLANGCSVMPSASSLFTGRESDMDALSASASNIESVVVRSEDSASQDEGQKLIDWVRMQMATFSTDDWESCKESHFTTTTNRLVADKNELAIKGKEEKLAELSAWEMPLAKGKVFLRKYREYKKNYKIEKAIEILPYVQEFGSFLQEQHVALSSSFLQVWLKVQFSGLEGDWSTNFDAMIQTGLEGLICGFVDMKDGVTPDSWLRSALFPKISEDISQLPIEECEENREPYHKSCRDIVTKASALGQDAIQVCIGDVETLGKVFEAGLPTSKIGVGEARAITLALDGPRFTLLKRTFEESPSGVEFLAPLKNLLKREANDSISDEGMELATDGLDSVELSVRVLGAEGEGLLLVQVRQTFNGEDVVLEALSDVVAHAMDAVKLWSPVRLLEKRDSLVAILDGISHRQMLVDVTLAWLLWDLLNRTFVVDASSGTSAAPISCIWRHSGDTDCLPDTTLAFLSTGSSFVASRQRSFQQVRALISASIEKVKDVADMAKSRIAKSTTNMATIIDIASCANRLFDASSSDIAMQTDSQLIVGWQENPETSAFSRMLEYKAQITALESTGLSFDLGTTDDSTIIRAALEGDTLLVGSPSIKNLQQLPPLLKGCPASGNVFARISKVADHVLGNFVSQCEMNGISKCSKATDCEWVSGISARQLIAIVVDPAVMPISKRAGVSAFGSSQGQAGAADVGKAGDRKMPSSVAFELLNRFVEAMDPTEMNLIVGDPPGGRVAVPIAEVTKKALLCTRMNEAASILLMFYVDLVKPSSCIRDHVMIENYLTAIDYIGRKIQDMKEALLEANSAETDSWKLPLSLPEIEIWAGRVAAIVQELKKRFYEQCTIDLKSLISSVEKRPAYDHYCNDTSFVENLVKRNLLPEGKPFQNEVVALFSSIRQLCKLSVRFNFADPRTVDPYKETVEHGNAVYSAAKKRVTITVACECLLTMTGEEKITEAAKILEARSDTLPQTVVDRLQAVVKKSTVAQSSKVQVKTSPSPSPTKTIAKAEEKTPKSKTGK